MLDSQCCIPVIVTAPSRPISDLIVARKSLSDKQRLICIGHIYLSMRMWMR